MLTRFASLNVFSQWKIVRKVLTESAKYGYNCGSSQFISSGAGWSSLAARRAHNPKVAGSNPAPATKVGFQPDVVRIVL